MVGGVRTVVRGLAVAFVAVAVPAVLIVTGFRVAATETFVRWELGRDGFPADRYGLADGERLELAQLGLDSIRPGTAGIDLLREARLPDGTAAFDGRELAHMQDVRDVYVGALRAQLVLVAVLVALAFGLAWTRWRTVVPLGLLVGALGTLAVALLAVPVILLGFDGLFTRFHELFFEADTWRFSTSDTLIRLYPERFWVDTAQVVAAVTLAQAVVLAIVAAWWYRRARHGKQPAGDTS